jgi:hypothetical protein
MLLSYLKGPFRICPDKSSQRTDGIGPPGSHVDQKCCGGTVDNYGFDLKYIECPFQRVCLTEDTSKLNMHVLYESVAQRDQVLQLPFAQGLNMAHNRIQDILSKLNNTP